MSSSSAMNGSHDKHTRKHAPKTLRRKQQEDDRWEDESEVEEEEEEFTAPPSKRSRLNNGTTSPRAASPELSEEAKAAKEREKDEEDRDAFARRLQAKDADKQRKLVEDRSSKSKEGQEAARRRELADQPDAVGGLRERARQEYLKKRETEKLALLRKQIAEETEELRLNPDLSRREKEEFAQNRKLLEIAEERLGIDDGQDGYMMPDDYINEKGKLDRRKKEQALYQRYVDRDEKGNERYVGESEEFEREQLAMAKSQIAQRDRVDEGQWDFVFDDAQQTQFVLDARLEGDAKPLSLEKKQLNEQLKAAENSANQIDQTRKSLPIYAYREELLKAVEDYQVLVIVGETGSGKSTQIPQYLYEAGYTQGGLRIACTQPRRLAAMSLARRVSQETGKKLGQEVGYNVRFDNCTTPDKTVVEYLTDGMLLNHFLNSPDLAEYSCIMIDEAHERTKDTEVCLGLLLDLAKERKDLKILISSATMNAQAFADFFADGGPPVPIFNIPGRMHAVDIHYTLAPEADFLACAVTTVFQCHLSMPLPGDILVFLTGEEEIVAAETSIQETAKKLGNSRHPPPELLVRPIYANLPSELQSKIFEKTPPGTRKVVLATNIAETSLTIDGIVYVIDPGFVKQNVYNPRLGMESLVVAPTSRASANQRAGRAGRTQPGKCFRLFTRFAFYNELDESTEPEILRTNVNSLVLRLKALGINDLLSFNFMDSPPPETLVRSLETLYALSALNSEGALTSIGRKMAELPLEPSHARAILASDQFGCAEEIISIVAMLGESSSLFFRPKNQKLLADSARARFNVPGGGDHFALLKIWNDWVDADFSEVWAKENFLQQRSLQKARDVRDQLASLCDRVEVEIRSCGAADMAPIKKALTAGFFANAARLQKGGDSYRTVKSGMTTYIHPSSTLLEARPKWLIYHELVLTSKEYMRSAYPIEPAMLLEAAPYYYKKKDVEALGVDKKMPKGPGAAAGMSKI